jgi:hypothetical protein
MAGKCPANGGDVHFHIQATAMRERRSIRLLTTAARGRQCETAAAAVVVGAVRLETEGEVRAVFMLCTHGTLYRRGCLGVLEGLRRRAEGN